MTRLSPLASGKSPGSLSFPLYIMCDDPEAWPVRPAGSLPRTGAGLGGVRPLLVFICTRHPRWKCAPSFWLVHGPIHSVTLTPLLSDQDEGELQYDEDNVPASGWTHRQSPALPVPLKICPAAWIPTLPLVNERWVAGCLQEMACRCQLGHRQPKLGESRGSLKCSNRMKSQSWPGPGPS